MLMFDKQTNRHRGEYIFLYYYGFGKYMYHGELVTTLLRANVPKISTKLFYLTSQ